MIFALLPASVHDLLVMAISWPLGAWSGFILGIVMMTRAPKEPQCPSK